LENIGVADLNRAIDEVGEEVVSLLSSVKIVEDGEAVTLSRDEILRRLSRLLYDMEFVDPIDDDHEVISTLFGLNDLELFGRLKSLRALSIARKNAVRLSKDDIEFTGQYRSRSYSPNEARMVFESVFGESIESYIKYFVSFTGSVIFNRNNEGHLTGFTLYEAGKSKTYYFKMRDYGGNVFNGLAYNNY